MSETTIRRRAAVATAIRGLVVLEAVVFLLAALLHLGARIPVGFAVLAEPVLLQRDGRYNDQPHWKQAMR